MSIFVPNKVYLRGILLHYFIRKKSAAEAHRILVQTYGDNALSDTTCRDWFRRSKNNDFQLEDKERSGAPKKFQDKELEQLLDEDPSQTLSELGKILQVDESTVSKRLKGLGMIQKQGHWVPYELKPRTTASTAEKKRCFASHRIVTGDEKWIHYDNPKRRKSWGKPGAQRHDKVILLHDNARPHVAKPVKTSVLPHPPYSPDIAPSDFHLFTRRLPGLPSTRAIMHVRDECTSQAGVERGLVVTMHRCADASVCRAGDASLMRLSRSFASSGTIDTATRTRNSTFGDPGSLTTRTINA
ncbi:MOS1T transposase, partial [Pseudoatta argentina]